MLSSGQIENPDTHLRLTQTRLLLETGHFGLPQDVGVDVHGNVAINEEGQRQMVYNPGQTLLFVPIYSFSKLVAADDADTYYTAAFLVSFLNYIIHALSAFLLFKIALAIGSSLKNAVFLALLFALTSYSFAFAQCTYEHHYEMFFVLLAYYCVLDKGLKYGALYAGLAISAGIIFRSTIVIAVPPLLFLQHQNKERIQLLLASGIGVIAIMYYNYYRFGHPLETGYSSAWQLAFGDHVTEFWSLARAPKGIYGLLLSPGKGLLVFSPTILLSLWGIKMFWKKHKRLTIAAGTLVIFYIGLFSMNFAWHGSVWSFGPRYILPIVPWLYLPVVELRMARKWKRGFIVAGMLSQVLLISVNYKREVLDQFITLHQVEEEEYSFNFHNIPYLVQFEQLVKVFPKNIHHLRNYQPHAPWTRELRTGSGSDVLNNSIEKNAINFWWVRIFHWNTSMLAKSLLFFIVMGIVAIEVLFLRRTTVYHLKSNRPKSHLK